MVVFLKFGLRAGAAQISKATLGVKLQFHSELQGVGFTPHPLLGASLFLLDKPAENDPVFCCGSCVCVCVRACVEAEEGSVVVGHCALWNCSPLPCTFSKSLGSGTFLFPSLPP